MGSCREDYSMPIAVIGMACRFPGDATSPEKLWDMLVNARNAWSEFPEDRINIEGFYHPSGNRAGSVSYALNALKLVITIMFRYALEVGTS